MSSVGPRELLLFYQLKKEHEYMLDRITAQETRTQEEVDKLKSQLNVAKREQEALSRAMQEFTDKTVKTEVERRKDFNREKELLERVCKLEASADSLKRQVAALEDRGTIPLAQSVAVEQRLLAWEQQPKVAVRPASELSNSVKTCQKGDQAVNTQPVSQEMVSGIHEVTLTSPTTSQHLTCRQSRLSHKAYSVPEIPRTTATEKNVLAAMPESNSEEEYFSCEERAAFSHRRRAARKAREAKARAMIAFE